ncbi:MAG: glycosyltransferase [Chlorobi bacterium]|nr:glycosyltransferase [Chlorobiota bacterium]
MKVLVLTNKPPYPPMDGGSLATLQMITTLANTGNDVSVFYLNTFKHQYDPADIPGEIAVQIAFHNAFVDTRIKILPALFSLFSLGEPYTLRRFYSQPISNQILLLAKKRDYDLIQFEGLAMTVYLNDLSFLSAKKVLRAHNVESVIWNRLQMIQRSPFRRFYLKHLAKRIKVYEKKMIQRFDALMPVSPIDAAQFSSWGFHGKVQVVPVGIDLEKYTANTEPPENVLIFLGALDWLPNINGLQWFVKEIWPEIHRTFPDVVFRIAGRNPDPGLQYLKKRSNIAFVGEVKDKIKFLHSGRIFIVPLFAGSGVRIKILEAMAAGCAIISTTTGAEGLPIEDGKHLLLADNRREFINKVKSLLSDDKRIRKITENALLLVRDHFDNRKITPLIKKFIAQL